MSTDTARELFEKWLEGAGANFGFYNSRYLYEAYSAGREQMKEEAARMADGKECAGNCSVGNDVAAAIRSIDDKG